MEQQAVKTAEGLPEKCFTAIPSTGEVVIIVRGEAGYNGTRPGNLPWYGQDLADLLNKQDGVTKGQAEAMLVGSLTGIWSGPGSDPANYDENGRYLG